MTKVTVKATGQVFYCFASKSEPGVWHKTTISGCSCKGYTHCGHCWHYDKVQAETKAARIEAFRTIDTWLAEVERSAQVQQANEAALAQSEATMAERPLAGYDIQYHATRLVDAAFASLAERAAAALPYDQPEEPVGIFVTTGHRCARCHRAATKRFLTEGWLCSEHAAEVAKPPRETEGW